MGPRVVEMEKVLGRKLPPILAHDDHDLTSVGLAISASVELLPSFWRSNSRHIKESCGRRGGFAGRKAEDGGRPAASARIFGCTDFADNLAGRDLRQSDVGQLHSRRHDGKR